MWSEAKKVMMSLWWKPLINHIFEKLNHISLAVFRLWLLPHLLFIKRWRSYSCQCLIAIDADKMLRTTQPSIHRSIHFLPLFWSCVAVLSYGHTKSVWFLLPVPLPLDPGSVFSVFAGTSSARHSGHLQSLLVQFCGQFCQIPKVKLGVTFLNWSNEITFPNWDPEVTFANRSPKVTFQN